MPIGVFRGLHVEYPADHADWVVAWSPASFSWLVLLVQNGFPCFHELLWWGGRWVERTSVRPYVLECLGEEVLEIVDISHSDQVSLASYRLGGFLSGVTGGQIEGARDPSHQ